MNALCKDAERNSRVRLRRTWDRFAQERDVNSRNQLVEYYLPLVHYHAQRMIAKLPSQVQMDELVSFGVAGLMEAIANFDPQRQIKFETYCAQRIRGAMLDELRNLDWVPRLVRSRARRFNEAQATLLKRLGRPPTDVETREHLGVSLSQYQKFRRDAQVTMTSSMHRPRLDADAGRQVMHVDSMIDHRQPNPLNEAQKASIKESLLNEFTRAERLVIILYYYEQMTMREIGQTLGLSESRVSQMHSSLLERLRAKIDDQQFADFLPRR